MRWTHSLPVLDKFSVVDTLVLDNLVLLKIAPATNL